MKMLQFKFEPQDIKIGADEILADLSYPVPVGKSQNERKPAAQRPKA